MSDTPRLALSNISKSYAGRKIVDDVSLDVLPGNVTCLLGPSGCGKSTTLRIAAGVEKQDSGQVLQDETVLSDGRHHMPPESRSIGLMFQDFALFPHLSVADNVAFGMSKSEKSGRVEELLSKVGMARHIMKFPHELSGGEQQRVALARALAPRPRVMLMDEPFSGLDDRLRDEIRDETIEVLRTEGTAVLLVTHEPVEAMRMADEIALMRGGKIVQRGAPYNIYNTPVDLEAAKFFSDVNVIHGTVNGALTNTPFGEFLAPGVPNGTQVKICIRPHHLKIEFDRHGAGPRPTPQNGTAANGRVVRSRFLGSESVIDFKMDYDGSLLTAKVPSVFLPKPDTQFWLMIRRDRCFVFTENT